MPLLDPNRSYTFSEIGKLKAPTDELLAKYGYSLERTLLDLAQYQGRMLILCNFALKCF
jgi:hypothetical protein